MKIKSIFQPFLVALMLMALFTSVVVTAENDRIASIDEHFGVMIFSYVDPHKASVEDGYDNSFITSLPYRVGAGDIKPIVDISAPIYGWSIFDAVVTIFITLASILLFNRNRIFRGTSIENKEFPKKGTTDYRYIKLSLTVQTILASSLFFYTQDFNSNIQLFGEYSILYAILLIIFGISTHRIKSTKKLVRGTNKLHGI